MFTFIADNAGMVGTIFFALFFLGVLVWVLMPGAGQYFADQANIPLKDDDDE